MNKSILLFSVLWFVNSVFISSQTTIDKVSINFGWIGNQQGLMTNDGWANNYQLSFGGQFIKNYFDWNSSVSYWDDGINSEFNCADCITYSNSSIIISSDIIYFPKRILPEFPFPVYLFIGLSYHHIFRKYIDGYSHNGDRGINKNFNLFTIDTGIGFYHKISERFRVNFSGKIFFAANKNEDLITPGSNFSFMIGVDYYFKDL